MADASTERIVNLAMYFAHEPVVTTRDIRDNVAGYPAGQEDDAFERMFERDKNQLRENGFVIVSEPGSDEYRLDRDATFAAEVDLSPAEAAALRAVGLALLGDPSFPFADDLRTALGKLSRELSAPAPSASARMADERPAEQAEAVSRLFSARDARKTVRFGYTNSAGSSREHEVEPYGLFNHDGRWYLVGRDTGYDEERIFAIARTRELEVSTAAPKTPDFEVPADFDVRAFMALPFQFGAEQIAAVLRFTPESGWRADALTGGVGTLEFAEDDSVTWHVLARDGRRLLRWVIDNGPGVELVEPAELAAQVRAGLEEVARLHG